MTLVFINENTPDKIERKLSILGYTPIRLPRTRLIDEPLASHPDMLTFYHENTLFTSAAYCEEAAFVFSDVREYMPKTKIVLTDQEQKSSYPYDAIFNIKTVAKIAFLKEDTVCPTVKNYLLDKGIKIVGVRQGYPACTTLSFADTLITADPGILKAAEENGLRTLKIENGDISLSPYEYGFIGGASAVYKSFVYFFGNIDLHRNAKEIKAAIKDAGYTPISLSSEPLIDLGGAVFIG